MTTTTEGPGLRKHLRATYEEALARVPEALKSQGFGVLTEIDVKATLQQKLGVEFRRYKILGACNPSFAHQALSTDLAAGMLLPCSVAVFEDDDGHASVIAVDPTRTVGAFGSPALTELAASVKQKLELALQRLE